MSPVGRANEPFQQDVACCLDGGSMDQGPGVMLNPFERGWHIEPGDLQKWENQRQHIGIPEFDHTCLREIKFLEQSGTADQANCLLGNVLRDSAIDRSKESHCVLAALDVNAGIWFWAFFFREFGCSLHPFRVGEAELDPFYPLSFVAVMQRNLHVASWQRRRSLGVVSRV